MSQVQELPRQLLDGILMHLELDKLRSNDLIIDGGEKLRLEIEAVQNDYVQGACRAVVNYELKDRVSECIVWQEALAST